jgi:cell division protein FtsN
VFDFYEILPDFEVVIPPAPDSGGGPEATARDVPPGTYYLQAGSFRQFEDADRRKANLALLGIGSEIRKVTVNERTHYRVQIGPIDDPAELRSMQRRLGAADIEYLALRTRDEAQ